MIWASSLIFFHFQPLYLYSILFRGSSIVKRVFPTMPVDARVLVNGRGPPLCGGRDEAKRKAIVGNTLLTMAKGQARRRGGGR